MKATIGQICEYWFTRDRLTQLFSFGLYFDIGEPACWACGRYWSTSRVKRWCDAPLDRCHIIPAAKGGADDASNLVLMCKECHDLAPNTTEPELLFVWMGKQNYLQRRTAHAVAVCKDMGIEFSQINLRDPHFIEWMTGRISSHASFNSRDYSAITSMIVLYQSWQAATEKRKRAA
jgi:5-methylcytosine-specific restriction endonuclease McrA